MPRQERTTKMFIRQLVDTDKNTDELKTDYLRLNDRVLIFADSHIMLDNLSLIEVIDLSSQRPIPTYFYIMGLVGLFLFISRDTTLFGLIVLGILGFLVYQFLKTRVTERFGLSLITNSGRARVLMAKDYQFLKDLAAKLCDAINDPQIKTLVANFNTQKIDVGTMTGGVISNQVDGNITQTNS